MGNFDALRAKYQGYSDDEILSAIQQTQYPEYSVLEVAEALDYKPRARNPAAAANDYAIEAANALAGGIGAAADFISPGNSVSRFIDDKIIKPGEESQSDAAKWSKRQFQERVAGADGVMDELGAVGRYVADSPGLAAAQAVGSFVGPGVAVKGGGMLARLGGAGAQGIERAGLAGGAAVGAAMSGGDAAGTAYDLAIKAGASEDEAVAAARQASVLPAIVGGAGGMVGAERLFAGGKGFAGGTISRALKTGALEAGQEGFEEGITQFEGQRAAMPFDPSIDPYKGVAAAAGMGAALGGITGAGVSLISPQSRQADKSPEPIADIAPILSAGSIDEAINAASDAVSQPIPFGDTQDLTAADANGQILLPPEPGQMLKPSQHIPVADATEITPESIIAPRVGNFEYAPPAGTATEMLPVGEASEIEPIPVGEVLEGDITTLDGFPFGSKTAANVRAKKEGLTPAAVVEIPGAGYVVRPEKAPDVAVTDLDRVAPLASGAGDVVGADTGRGGRTVRPDVDADGGVPVSAAAPVPSSGTAVAVGDGNVGAPNTLTPGATVTIEGKSWQVVESTPAAVKLADGEGSSKFVGVGSKTWAKIAPAATETALPAANSASTQPDAEQLTAAPAAPTRAGSEPQTVTDEFIRAATKEERLGGRPKHRAMQQLQDAAPRPGFAVVFKPYGDKGAGFYYAPSNEAAPAATPQSPVDTKAAPAEPTQYFPGGADKNNIASIFKSEGALGREEVWRGPAADVPAKLAEFRKESADVPAPALTETATRVRDTLKGAEPAATPAVKPPEQQTEAEFGAVEKVKAIARAEQDLADAKAGKVSVGKFSEYKSKAGAIIGARKQLESVKAAAPETFAADHLAAINRAIREGKAPSAENIARYQLPADVQAYATHTDPGEPAEVVTPTVVKEAIKTALRTVDRKPSEMKAELLAKVDAAIASAPDVATPKEWNDTPEKERRQKFFHTFEAARKKALDEIGYVTFNIEGDGVFKVLNTQAELTTFRSKASASPGFKAQRPGPTAAEDAAEGYQRGSGGPATAVRNMIDDGDPQAAVDYAAAVGLDIREVLAGDKVRLPKVKGLTATETPAPETSTSEPTTAASETARPARDETTTQTIALRKRMSVLRSLLDCMG